MMPLMPRLDRLTLTGRHVQLEPLATEHVGPLLRAATESRSTFGLTLVPDSLPAMQKYVETLLAEEGRGLRGPVQGPRQREARVHAPARGHPARGESLPFAVREPRGDVVGATRFMTIEWWSWAPHAAPLPVPAGPDVLEIGGTWYAERAQRTGINTEAKLLLCTHAFETLRVRRVSWKTDARNTRSREAILRLGARFDGVIRAHRAGFDGVVRDAAFFSLLQGEWPDAKRVLTAKLLPP